MTLSNALRIGVLLLWIPAVANAAESGGTRPLSSGEFEKWLEEPSGASAKDSAFDGSPEAPPLPPRHHGVIIESSIGAFGHLGPLKNVSPVAPWFQIKVGFEIFPWLLVFGEADTVFSSTSYAPRPPETRTYRLYGGGGGLRLTFALLEELGLSIEGSGGLATASEDILNAYGYSRADEFHPYFGGLLGIEWYPVNPHLTIALRGGVRAYTPGLNRDQDGQAALVWMVGPSIRYTF